jgi:hypothetical protein
MKEDLHIEKCIDLDSCMDWIKDLYGEEPNFLDWFKVSDEDCVPEVHHGMGRWLRNTLELWYDGPPVKWFNEHEIFHADDMSSIILQSLHRRENKRPIDFEGQIKAIQDFWEENKNIKYSEEELKNLLIDKK